MDEVIIRDFFPENTIEVLNLLDDSLSRIANLRKLLRSTYSEHFLLTNKKTIRIIIGLLNEEEVKKLASMLEIDVENGNPWEILQNVNLKTKRAQYVFYSFFELEPPTLLSDEISNNQIIETIVPEYKLFNHQIDAVEKVKQTFQSSVKVLLHMPTGSGKTRTAMNVICEHIRVSNKIIIWLANTEELCSQAADEFVKAWRCLGNRDLQMYRLWGNRNIDLNSIGSGFIIASFQKINSLANSELSKLTQLASKTTLIVMDEAHMAIAPTFQQVLSIFTSYDAKLLGLSATPGRTWNNIYEDRKLSDFFQTNKVTLTVPGYDNPVDYLTQEGYLAKVVHSPLMYRSGIRLTDEDIRYLNEKLLLPGHILNKISEDIKRNALIIQKVKELLKEHTVENITFNHTRILLFAITVSQSNLLATAFQSLGIESYSLTSETLSTDRKNIIKKFKSNSSTPIVLCNYGILTTGFDAPKTSCAVITRPTDSLVLYSQMIGRAIRGPQAGGNNYAEIITVVDSTLPGFDSVESAFYNWEDVW